MYTVTRQLVDDFGNVVEETPITTVSDPDIACTLAMLHAETEALLEPDIMHVRFGVEGL